MKHKHPIDHSQEDDDQQRMQHTHSHRKGRGSSHHHHDHDDCDHHKRERHHDENYEHNHGDHEHGSDRHQPHYHSDEHRHGRRGDGHGRHGSAHGRHGRGRREERQHHLEHGLFRGRKFSAQDMQLLLLHFLSEQPSYGYQLIKRFDELSKGLYVPSPGVVYPALTFLAEQDYVTVSAEENRKLYAVANLGITYLTGNKMMLDELLARLALYAQNAEAIKQMQQNDVAQSAISAQLAQAERDLLQALNQVHQKTVDEQDQTAKLLQQVTRQLVN